MTAQNDARREELLAQLAAIAGPDQVEAALELAVEASKLGLRTQDLIPRVQAWSWLGILGMHPTDGQGFYAWSRQHRLVSDEEWEEARKANLLHMRPDQECPAVSPTDGEQCIRELHHPHRHVDENGWVW